MGEPSKPPASPSSADGEVDVEELLQSSPRSPVLVRRCANCLLGLAGVCHCFMAPPPRDGGLTISPRTWELYSRSSSPSRERFYFETERDPPCHDLDDSGLEKGENAPVTASPPDLDSIFANYASGFLFCLYLFNHNFNDLSRRRGFSQGPSLPC